MIRRYIVNILISIDQLLNAILGGDPDETISSRAAKSPHLPHWYWLGRILEAIDPGHMRRALEADEGKRTLFK
jgi:hypothetical protein